MIDATVATLLRNGSFAPPTLTDGQIKAEMILYDMEEERFLMEFPELALAHTNTTRVDATLYDIFRPDISVEEFDEETVAQAV